MSRHIRLTGNDLHRVIEESVNRVLMESIRSRALRLREGKYVNNRVPFPLSNMDYVNDDGDIETLSKDRFADEYTSPEAEAKREERFKRTEKAQRLFYDGTLKDTSLEANLRVLKQGDDKWMDMLSKWGAHFSCITTIHSLIIKND